MNQRARVTPPAKPSIKEAAQTEAAAPPRRERKVVDPHAAGAAVIADNQREKPVDEPTVRVMVPRKFNLTDDWHEVHMYEPGEQDMPTSHAEHFYAAANGVTKV